MVYQQYTWILGLTVPAALISAFGIGANDVANSFASSVGSKAITMGQAICIAAVCEFLGAVLLGAAVTDTIKNNIAKTSAYRQTPGLLMYVMFSALCTSAIWDNITCHLELPVSTTHTIVGSITGASIAVFGFDSILWSAKQDPFPYVKGMTPVFLSWACSPLAAAIVVTILYTFVRTFILRSKNSFKRAFFAIPLLVGLTFFVFVIFVIQTGNKNNTYSRKFELWKSFVVSIGIGAFFAILTAVAVLPALKGKIDRDHDMLNKAKNVEAANGTNGTSGDVNLTSEQIKAAALANDEEVGNAKVQTAADVDASNQSQGLEKKFGDAANGFMAKSGLNWVGRQMQKNVVGRTIFYGANYDMHSVVDETHQDYDKKVVAVWQNAGL